MHVLQNGGKITLELAAVIQLTSRMVPDLLVLGDRLYMEQLRFHHIGVAVRDIRKAIPLFQDLFGYELRSGPFDDPIQKVSVCFLSRRDEDMIIELVAPLGDDSPVTGKLKAGGGAYHICYEVPDIRASIERFVEKHSVLISGPDPAVAFNQREIAWLMTEARVLVELVQA